MVSTPLKNISQKGNLPQIGVKIKNVWNHHPDVCVLVRSPSSRVPAKSIWLPQRLHDTNSTKSTVHGGGADKEMGVSRGISHRIHVWYIYLHLPYKLLKCRYVYHAWILWVLDPFNSHYFGVWIHSLKLTVRTCQEAGHRKEAGSSEPIIDFQV